MTSFLENLNPHSQLLNSKELLRQFNTNYDLILIRNPAVNFAF